MAHKQCAACKESKLTADFGCNAARPDGLQSHCKTCRKDKAATKRARHIEEQEAKTAQLLQWADNEAEIENFAKRQARAHNRHYQIPDPDGFRYALDLIPLEKVSDTDVKSLPSYQRAMGDPWYTEAKASIQAIKEFELSMDGRV